MQTGGGKQYIPPDEALDRVVTMLGATCSGLITQFGGDRTLPTESNIPATADILDIISDQPSLSNVDRGSGGGVVAFSDSNLELVGGGEEQKFYYTPKKMVFNTPNNSCKWF